MTAFLIRSISALALAPGCSPRVGDVDGAGGVDASDPATLLGAWNGGAAQEADLNGDDVVDAQDLALLPGN